MSVLQRIIVRMGVEADVPSLHFGELGMDTDTLTMRLGDDTPSPLKIMTTKSTGIFDFSTVEKMILPNVEFGTGAGFAGLNFDSLKQDQGIVISLGSGQFRQTDLFSSDSSVIITNGAGQAGRIDLRVSAASITNALGDIRQELMILGDRIDAIDESDADSEDTLMKLVQLTGRPAKFTEMGTFLGNIIPDNATIKTALQALETALESLGANNFNLEIVGNDEFVLGLQLTPDNIVIFEGATPDLAGLMIGSDKFKLDFITVTSPVDLNAIQVTAFERDDVSILLVNSNETTVNVPIATSEFAGAITAADKAKLDFLQITAPHNIDQIEERIDELETAAPRIFYTESPDPAMWTSTDTITSFDVDITGDLQSFVVYYDRTVEGFEFKVYDAITANGIEIAPAENTTKAYRGAAVFFKARTDDWYFLNNHGIAVKVAAAEDNVEEITIACGSTNAVEIKGLILL